MLPFTTCMCFHTEDVTKGRWTSYKKEVAAVTPSPQNGLFIQISEQLDHSKESLDSSDFCTKGNSNSAVTADILYNQSSGNLFHGRVTSITGGHQEAEERLLMRTVGHHTKSHSRFLTMRRLKRRKPPTQALRQYSALLDDIYHGPTKCVLQQVGRWNFNAFVLNNICGGRPVTILCTFLLHYYGLIKSFNLDFASVWKFFSLIEDGYHSSNPYHNSIHAADVTQAMHCYLQESIICSSVTPMELLGALIAAVCHDLDHPGVNQPFLIATDNHLAILYNNASVLENHHWRCAMGCLWESGFLNLWTLDDVDILQEIIRSLILATDITRQNEFLSTFKRTLKTDTLDMSKAKCRHFSLQIALKCADICNPCRPWDVCRHWAQKICDEFYRQGDYERQLNLPVTPLCDRHNNTVAKIQAGFIKFVVQPLFDSWDCWLSTSLSNYMISNLKGNLSKWEQDLLNETKSNVNLKEFINKHPKVEITISTLSENSVSSNESGKSVFGSLQCISQSLLFKRRHSLPVHASCFLPRTIIRRESVGVTGHPMLVYETVSVGESPPSSLISPRMSDYFFSQQSSGSDQRNVIRRQSFPLQPYNCHNNQALRFIYPPTPLLEENHSCISTREIPINDDEERKKTITKCTTTRVHVGVASKCPPTCCQIKNAHDAEIPNVINKELQSHFISRRASLESGTKQEMPRNCNMCCQKNRRIEKDILLNKSEIKINHNNSNKENKPPDKSIWKNRLWKSLNHEYSFTERSPLLSKPQSQSFADKRRCSAPVIRIEKLCKSARGSENWSEYISKRRGSAPNGIYAGNSSPTLCRKITKEEEPLFSRRSSAPVNSSLEVPN